MNFHIVTHDFAGRELLDETFVQVITDTIKTAIPQLIEGADVPEVTSGPEDRQEFGMATILPRREEDSPWWQTDDDSFYCGNSGVVGENPATVWINADRISLRGEGATCALRALTLHEVGHMMGFFHVESPNHSMHGVVYNRSSYSKTEREHAQHAYRLGRDAPYAGRQQQGSGSAGRKPAISGEMCHGQRN